MKQIDFLKQLLKIFKNNSETSTFQENQKKLLSLAMKITDGDSGNLELVCPICNKNDVIFSFARSNPPRYGLFIKCDFCGYIQHYSLGDKPKNFREDLVIPEFQERQNIMAKLS